jgi:hypothetical protein
MKRNYPSNENTTEDDIRHGTPKCDRMWIVCHEVEKLQRSLNHYGINPNIEVEKTEISIKIPIKGK